jgi:hypothetical protein
MWDILKINGYSSYLINVIQSLCSNTNSLHRDITAKKLTAEINGGGRQGCPVSSLLFNIYLDEAIKE